MPPLIFWVLLILGISPKILKSLCSPFAKFIVFFFFLQINHEVMRSLRIKNTHLCIHLFTSSTTPAVSDTKKALNKCFRIQWIKINSCHVSIKTSYNLYSHFCFYLNFFQFISYSYPSVSPVFSNSYYFGLLIFFQHICSFSP